MYSCGTFWFILMWYLLGIHAVHIRLIHSTYGVFTCVNVSVVGEIISNSNSYYP